MLLRPLVLSAAVAVSAGAAVQSPTANAGYVSLDVTVAPPAPLFERVVVRPGWTWAPGYWRWNGYRHVWIGGYWTPERIGYGYMPAAWVRVGPAWRFRHGYWAR